MLDRSVLRWGGGAAMVGAAISLVFNLLHPRSTDALDSARAELQLVADSGIWTFDHYMLAWAVAFSFVGIIAIGWSFENGAPATWARFALAAAIGSFTIVLVTLAVDGMVVGRLAEDWAASQDPETAGAAVAAAEISLGLFTMTIGSLFGITPILFGLTNLSSRLYPRWLGWLAIAGGVVGLLAASIQYLSGPSTFTINVLFLIASLAFTVWLFVMGWFLWKAPVESPAVEARSAVAA